MSLLCYGISRIPDLSLNEYQFLSDPGISGVLKRHSIFLRQWHSIGLAGKVSFHLLYCFDNARKKGTRLTLYFLVNVSDEENLAIIRELVAVNPLTDYYDFVECEPPKYCYSEGYTLFKKERKALITTAVSDKEKEIFYVPQWEMNDSARLRELFKMMEVVGKTDTKSGRCAYRVDIYPVSDIQDTLTKTAEVLKELEKDSGIKLTNNSYFDRGDGYTQQTVRREFEEWQSNIESTPHFRMNVYSFAENRFFAKMILNSVASEGIEQGDYSLGPLKSSEGMHNPLSRLGTEPWTYCEDEKKAVLPSWPTTFLLNEAESFFRFPILYESETIEMQKETALTVNEEGIKIGVDQNGYPICLPVEYLSRHAFFTGAPGSGKTYTMLHILTELKKKNIPFLVMEPAKKEYRAVLCDERFKDVYLFSPHVKSHFPLRMNPFEFPIGVRLSEHINALLEVFKGTFYLEGAVYKFLSSSIERAYINQGWDIEDINTRETELDYPTMSEVYEILKEEVDKSSYGPELKGNITSFLLVRLGSLMERDAGELFDTKYSTFGPDKWLTKSAIVELEVLGEEAKNFFVLMVCHYILETLRANPNGGVDAFTGELMPVRHAVFIEEAHNIIASSAVQDSSESVNPKVSATTYIVKMLAEVRALREAIIIADQLPTAITVEVTKNTGLKLVHRLPAQDDRAMIGSTMSATSLQLEQIASYSKGQALLFYEQTRKPFQIQVDKWEKPEVEYDYTDDEELYSKIMYRRHIAKIVRDVVDEWLQIKISGLQNISDEQEQQIYLLKMSKRYRDYIAFFKVEEYGQNCVDEGYKEDTKRWLRENSEIIRIMIGDVTGSFGENMEG